MVKKVDASDREAWGLGGRAGLAGATQGVATISFAPARRGSAGRRGNRSRVGKTP